MFEELCVSVCLSVYWGIQYVVQQKSKISGGSSGQITFIDSLVYWSSDFEGFANIPDYVLSFTQQTLLLDELPLPHFKPYQIWFKQTHRFAGARCWGKIGPAGLSERVTLPRYAVPGCHGTGGQVIPDLSSRRHIASSLSGTQPNWHWGA